MFFAASSSPVCARPSTKESCACPAAYTGSLRQAAPLPPWHNGDHLTQAEFHRRYEAYPEDVKFELIGGIVYMASPLKRPHGTYHPELSLVLAVYKAAS